MIHTDGANTIANHPGYSRHVDVIEETQDTFEGTSALLERNYAGLTVQVRWVDGTEHVLLCVARGEERYSTVIDGKDASDAFEHPYVYLALKGVSFDA